MSRSRRRSMKRVPRSSSGITVTLQHQSNKSSLTTEITEATEKKSIFSSVAFAIFVVRNFFSVFDTLCAALTQKILRHFLPERRQGVGNTQSGAHHSEYDPPD